MTAYLARDSETSMTVNKMKYHEVYVVTYTVFCGDKTFISSIADVHYISLFVTSYVSNVNFKRSCIVYIVCPNMCAL